MAGLFEGLLGGGAGDEYGDLLTPAQRNAVQARGLLAMAGAFGEAAMPSRTPIPIGAVLGKAAGALGAGQDAAMEAAIKNALTVQKVKELKNTMAMRALLAPYYQQLAAGNGAAQPAPPAQPALGAGVPAPGPAGVGGGDAVGLGLPEGLLGSDYASQLVTPPPRVGMAPRSMGDTLMGQLPDAAAAPRGAPLDLSNNALGLTKPIDRWRLGGALDPFAYSAPTSDPAGAPKAIGGPVGIPESSWDQQRAAGQLQGPLAAGGSGGGAPPVAPPEAGGDTDVAAAPDTVVPPGGGGLLGVSPDLYRPVEATPADAQIRRRLDLIERFESGGRNINQQVIPAGGGYNPSVGRVTGPSSASGYFQMIDPTWRHAAQLAGIDTSQYPRAIDAPYDLQRQAAAKLLQTEGLAPWAPYNANLRAALQSGGGAPDQVIPSGGGGNLPVVRAQYAPGGGGPPPIQPGLLAAPGAPGGPALLPPSPSGGKVPGTNFTPQQLMALDALSEMSGLGTPFKGFLESYYKSPGYLGDAATAQEQARRAISEPSDIRIGAAKAIQDRITGMANLGLQLGPDGQSVVKIPGWIEAQTGNKTALETAQQNARVDAERMIEQNKASMEIGTYTVLGPDGRSTEVQMPRYQALLQMQDQQQRLSQGAGPRPGDVVGKPIRTPAEEELGRISAKDISENRKLAQDAAKSIETNKEARSLIDGGIFSGALGDRETALAKLGLALKLTGKTTQETVANTETYFATIGANVGRLIKQFGSGTGLSDADRQFAESMAAGKRTLDEASLRRILDINDRAALAVIHTHNQSVAGVRPDVSLTPLAVPEPTPYQGPTTTAPRERHYNPRTGTFSP